MLANKPRTYDQGGGEGPVGRQSLGRAGHAQSSRKQPVHILAACARCRNRKSKCDARLPRCGPCEKTGAVCNYWDPGKNKFMPRSYVIELQSQIKGLEAELAQLRVEAEYSVPVEDLVQGGGLVKIRRNAESRFLGPSSGINMTKLVMEFARSFAHSKTMAEIIPNDMAEQVRKRFEEEYAKPTSKIYPLTSDIPAPNLPPLSVTNKLVQDFMATSQVLYPVLHEPTFLQDVQDVYNNSTIPYKNFVVRIVVALSMHKTDARWAGLADSFYLAALQYLEGTVRPRNLGTLQCFALIAQYSISTPTRTASYWIVGLAAKLLQELRMTDEATIGCDEQGNSLDPLEVDMRRRLFYICTNMELALAHSLGRPSAFSVTYDHKDIAFYSEVDDRHITRAGINAGAPPTFKKQMSIHHNKMRWLQLEIRHSLYLNRRDVSEEEADQWFKQMEEKVDRWMKEYPKPPYGGRSPEEGFRLEYNTIMMFLFRPSPQVPKPLMRSVRRCYEVAVDNIHIQRNQVERGSFDVTWVFAQQLFLAMNIVLWTLSYSELRREHTREDVTAELETALRSIYIASRKWPGVEAALSLYTVLVDYCLQAYDGDAEISYGAASPSSQSQNGPTSPQSISNSLDVNPLLSSPSTAYSSVDPSPAISMLAASWNPVVTSQAHDAGYVTHNDGLSADYGLTPISNMTMPSPSFSQGSFDPSSFFNPLPSPRADLLLDFSQDTSGIVESFADPYIPFMPYPQPQPMEGITMEQQTKLMEHLEVYGLGTPPNISSPHSNAA